MHGHMDVQKKNSSGTVAEAANAWSCLSCASYVSLHGTSLSTGTTFPLSL